MSVVFLETDTFIRRIMRYYYNADEHRVTSSAFKKKSRKPDDDCSVFLDRIMEAPDEFTRTALPGQLFVDLPAREVLRLELLLKHTPNKLEPSHCSIKVETNDQCDQLAAASSLRPPHES